MWPLACSTRNTSSKAPNPEKSPRRKPEALAKVEVGSGSNPFHTAGKKVTNR